jgi:hypothetical protein
MRLRLSLPLVMLAGVLTVGCDDVTDLDDDRFSDFAGDFEATRFEFTADDDPTLREDLVLSGAQFRADIDDTGEVSTTLTNVDGTVIRRVGVLEQVGTEVRFRETGVDDPRIFTVTRANNGLVLTDDAARFDFDDDGVLDEARFEADLRTF